jgi:uncharacterized membrane protein YphA (DoxX/SURF4 family)
MRCKYFLVFFASLIVGLIFISSGVGKLLGKGAFLLTISSTLEMPATLASIIANWLPLVELVLGILLVTGVAAQLVALCSTVPIAGFITYNSWMIGHGLAYQPCGCLGVLEKLNVGKLSTIHSLYIDIGLLVLVFLIYFLCPSSLFAMRPWFLKKNITQNNSQAGNQ